MLSIYSFDSLTVNKDVTAMIQNQLTNSFKTCSSLVRSNTCFNAASTDTIYRLSPSEKNYPYAVDSLSGDSDAGDINLITAFRAPFLPTDEDLTVPGVIVTMSGKTYCYITAHKNLENKKVLIPSTYSGWPVTIIKDSGNVNVKSDFVSDGYIEIDVSNNYGDIILRFGR